MIAKRRPDLHVSVHISSRGRPYNREEGYSFAKIRRYLTSRGVQLTSANSLIRLAKESHYRKRQGDFVFGSCHAHITEPRLRRLASDVGIRWFRRGDDACYEKCFHWIPAGKHGRRLMEPLMELVHSEL